MFKRISQVGSDTKLTDLFSGCRCIFIKQEAEFSEGLCDYLSSKFVYLLSSGTAAFYIILKALKCLSSKREVVLPAYTAPAMVLPVLDLGLVPVLCDISLSDFNLDLDLLPEVVTLDTLCIVPTHLFGIVTDGINGLKEKWGEIFIVEDCAQSMGSKIKEKNTGSFSDIGFLSFNRGKNLPTYGGGSIFTNSIALAQNLKAEIDKLEKQSVFFKFMLPFKITAFSFAVRPDIYRILYPAVSQFKDNRVPESISIRKYSNFQAGVGLSLLERIDGFSEQRYQNGMVLINGLKNIKEIIVPHVSEDSRPAFNRLPVVFKYLGLREKAEKELWKVGIDTSRMYLKPLQHIFDLGYKREDFPNATYFAEHLLTLPTHPLLAKTDLNKILEVIRNI